MLILLSPAKNLDFDPADPSVPVTEPRLTTQTRQLAAVTRKLKASDLTALMAISEQLADLNRERFRAFKADQVGAGTKQAVLAFNGDVYRGLQAQTMDSRDLAFAQQHLRILSGLYGLLRPLDQIMPYRLEMGTKLATRRGGDLYEFWGPRLSRLILQDLKTIGSRTIVNLASQEYFGAVDLKALKVPKATRVISPVFKEVKDGKARVLSFFAKAARGRMARYAIDHRITDAEHLLDFDWDGYRIDTDASTDTQWVFTRPQPAPVAQQRALEAAI